MDANLPQNQTPNHPELLSQAENSHSTVPPCNENFTGRLNELLTLRGKLLNDKRSGVIHGPYGIGKTELALTHAQTCAAAYPGGRFLVRCGGKATLRDALLGQSDLTAFFSGELDEEEWMHPDAHFAALQRCLEEQMEEYGRVLLVLDNITDPALLSSSQTDLLTGLGSGLHLLATTRLAPQTGTTGHWLSLDRLPDSDALALLEKFRPLENDGERDAARRIVRRLGGFTLAVELVAAWLGKRRDLSCTDFLEHPGLEDLEASDAQAEEGDVTLRRHNDERRLQAILAPSLDSLSPAALLALEFAALLPPDHIALPWLRELVGAQHPEFLDPPPPDRPDAWENLISQLTGLAFFHGAPATGDKTHGMDTAQSAPGPCSESTVSSRTFCAAAWARRKPKKSWTPSPLWPNGAWKHWRAAPIGKTSAGN